MRLLIRGLGRIPKRQYYPLSKMIWIRNPTSKTSQNSSSRKVNFIWGRRSRWVIKISSQLGSSTAKWNDSKPAKVLEPWNIWGRVRRIISRNHSQLQTKNLKQSMKIRTRIWNLRITSLKPMLKARTLRKVMLSSLESLAIILAEKRDATVQIIPRVSEISCSDHLKQHLHLKWCRFSSKIREPWWWMDPLIGITNS